MWSGWPPRRPFLLLVACVTPKVSPLTLTQMCTPKLSPPNLHPLTPTPKLSPPTSHPQSLTPNSHTQSLTANSHTQSLPGASRSPPQGLPAYSSYNYTIDTSKWSERRSKSLQINRRRAPRAAATPQKPPPRPPAKPPESLKNRPKMHLKTDLPKFPQRGARSPRFGEGPKAPKRYVFHCFFTSGQPPGHLG